ncbi:MAG: transposase [Bacteroidia bacterium]|nr:transposase [Bacteroidia bacterium]
MEPIKAHRRVFSEEFKKNVVTEFLEENISVKQISDRYDLSPAMFRRWKQKFVSGKSISGIVSDHKEKT